MGKVDGKEVMKSPGLGLLSGGQGTPSPPRKIEVSVKGLPPIWPYKLGSFVRFALGFLPFWRVFCKIGGSGGPDTDVRVAP